MAAEPVVRGRAEQVTVAVSTVVVFGTLAIFLYPALYHLNAHYLLLARHPRPLWDFRRLDHSRSGASRGRRPCRDGCGRKYGGHHQDGARHDARAISHHALDLSVAASRAAAGARARRARPRRVRRRRAALSFPGSRSGSWPWRRSTRPSVLPHALVTSATALDTFLLAMAMAALGVTTHSPPSARRESSRSDWQRCFSVG